MRNAMLAVMAISIAACAAEPSRPATTAGLCPAWPLRHYSAAQLLRVAAEMTDLRARDPAAESPRVLEDYRIDRARRRAICGED